MRNGVLRQKWRLEPDFGADPFSLGVGRIRLVLAEPAAAELWPELRTLNLIELLDLPPGFVADSSGNINFQSHDRHNNAKKLAMREPLIQHEIYQHAGDADVHPQRPGPARDRPMLIITSPQPADESDDHHGNNHNRERHMGDEYDQINNMPKVVAQKTDISNVIMEIQIAGQKQSRGNDGGDHAGAMRGNLPTHDQTAANEQQHRASSVQAGDQGREVSVLFRDHILAIRRQASSCGDSPSPMAEGRSLPSPGKAGRAALPLRR